MLARVIRIGSSKIVYIVLSIAYTETRALFLSAHNLHHPTAFSFYCNSWVNNSRLVANLRQTKNDILTLMGVLKIIGVLVVDIGTLGALLPDGFCLHLGIGRPSECKLSWSSAALSDP